MDARQRRSIKKASLRQEKQTADDIGGRTQANSGATRLGGGADVRLPGQMRIECKFTEKDFYVLKLKELEKLRKQANQNLEVPVFQFAFKFRSTMAKYAVTGYGQTAPPTLMGHLRWLGGASILIRHEELKKELLQYDLLLVELEGRTYQIWRWDDFLEKLQGRKDFSMGCQVVRFPCSVCTPDRVCHGGKEICMEEEG